MRRLHAILLVLALLYITAPVRGEVRLIGTASIPGTATDLSNLTDTLSDKTPHNRLGSMGSGIAYTGHGDRYVMVADRGPSNGDVAYRCRFQEFDIAVDPAMKPAVRVKLVATTLLGNETGKPLVGDAGAFADNTRLDPEGVRISPTGTIYLSDEYGPGVFEFDRAGKRLRSLAVPAKFAIAHPSKDPAKELPPHNTSGRQVNRGFEGLAITPDGAKLYAILQSPLIQDAGLNDAGERLGVNNRIIEIDAAAGKTTRELVYPLDEPKHGVNEILAISDHTFLVLERDNKDGAKSKSKRLFRIDVSGASDVSGVEKLPAKGLPPGVKPVSKSPFLDLLDPRFGLANDAMPEKIEGLAWGPDLADGSHVLIVTTDNDFRAEQPSWFYVFAVPASDVPDYTPQKFNGSR